ncbi:hypothetical protein I550_3078 [Mycobacterium intracellulare 1956]|uniref:Uncharacterized protein n=1 Tax=Mycobacterium intracellulare 1956 TaxID=1299331 RepID=X8CHK6_MYCIT|nr:hypothetical protein I550_3078 [Mycobacterium intracellulare 1956]
MPAADDARGESNLTKRVARFDTSAVFASITVNSVAGAARNLAGEPGSMTVSSSGGAPRTGEGAASGSGGAGRGSGPRGTPRRGGGR